jgi:hypothetical protein
MKYYTREKEFITPLWSTLWKYKGKPLGYELTWFTAWVLWKNI